MLAWCMYGCGEMRGPLGAEEREREDALQMENIVFFLVVAHLRSSFTAASRFCGESADVPGNLE